MAQFKDTICFESMDKDSRDRFIGTVTDVYRKKSQNGNDYLKLTLSDEVGSMQAIIGDWGNRQKLTSYLNKGNPLPEKGNIVSILGSKGDDILFMDDINILDKKIYMKLSELK